MCVPPIHPLLDHLSNAKQHEKIKGTKQIYTSHTSNGELRCEFGSNLSHFCPMSVFFLLQWTLPLFSFTQWPRAVSRVVGDFSVATLPPLHQLPRSSTTTASAIVTVTDQIPSLVRCHDGMVTGFSFLIGNHLLHLVHGLPFSDLVEGIHIPWRSFVPVWSFFLPCVFWQWQSMTAD